MREKVENKSAAAVGEADDCLEMTWPRKLKPAVERPKYLDALSLGVELVVLHTMRNVKLS